MKKENKHFIIIFFLIIVFLKSINANFACGYVNNSNNFSSSWLNVIIYYEQNKSNYINCTTNPSGKFCCDLNEIKSISFSPGKSVYAEVFDIENNKVSDAVNLITTSEGIQIFPEMQIEDAIIIEGMKNVLINLSEINLKIIVAKNYNNIKYKINNETRDLCENCNEKDIELELQKGKNEIEIIAYNNHRKIIKKIDIYSLDYLNFQYEFECPKCKNNKIIPSDQEVKMSITINSSHDLEGLIQVFIPSDWDIQNEYFYYDESYNLVELKINGKDLKKEILLKSPSIFLPKKYIFKINFLDFEYQEEIKVFGFLLRGFYISAPVEKIEWSQVEYSVNENNPLVIKDVDENVDMIALFPKEKKNLRINIKTENSLFSNKKEYLIRINTKKDSIKKLYLVIKVPKNEKKVLYDRKGKIIDIKIKNEDEKYIYYEAELEDLYFEINNK